MTISALRICYVPRVGAFSPTGSVTVIRWSFSVFGNSWIIPILIVPNSTRLKVRQDSTAFSFSVACQVSKALLLGCPRSRMNKKQEKLAFPHGGKSKFSENQLSLTRESQKMLKIILRSWAKCGKRKKQPVARVFSSKIAKNSVSLASDERKTLKTAHRSWAKCRNCQKRRFACKRRAKNAENGLSLVSEMQKTLKTAFRLQATSEKRGKWGFGASRKVEIRKNNVSGCPDELFLEKMNRRGVPKLEKFEKRVLGMSRKGQMWYFQAQSAGWRCWLNMIALHITETPLQLLS